MKSVALVALFALLSVGASPAFAGTLCGDFDSDTVDDCSDNCSDKINPGQVDTDGDDCGNVCDADYNNDGSIGFPDFGQFTAAFGNPVALLCDHTEPVTGPPGFPDFGVFTASFGGVAGPSGTTTGTTACP